MATLVLVAAVGCNGWEGTRSASGNPEVSAPQTQIASTTSDSKAASSQANVSTNEKSPVETSKEAIAPSKPEPTATTPPALAEPAGMPSALMEVVKLAKGGVNDEVMLAYVQHSTNTFDLTPDQIIYLTDLGVAPDVLTAMQTKGIPTPPLATVPPPATAAPIPQPVPLPVSNAAPTNTPAVTVLTPNYVTNNLLESVAGPAPAPTTTVVQQPVTISYFREALSPYGSWVDVPGYGLCWRPDYAVLGPDWRPYADGGRWVWTESGWYWVSDYAWGWAPFHYGRWCSTARFGWVWLPDTTWGPAWVCWRRTASHCGWAPLPPGAYWGGSSWYYDHHVVGFDFAFGLGYSEFVFLPWGRFCEHRPYHFYTSRGHAERLYGISSVANVTVVGHDHSVVFQGVGRQTVTAATRTPIPQASLRETAWTAAKGSAPKEQLSQSPTGLVIQSPRLDGVAPAQPPQVTGSGKSPARVVGSGSAIRNNLQDSSASAGESPRSRETSVSTGRVSFDPTVGGDSAFIPASRGLSIPAAQSQAVPRSIPATAAPSSISPSSGIATTVGPSPSSSIIVGAGGRRIPATTANSLSTPSTVTTSPTVNGLTPPAGTITKQPATATVGQTPSAGTAFVPRVAGSAGQPASQPFWMGSQPPARTPATSSTETYGSAAPSGPRSGFVPAPSGFQSGNAVGRSAPILTDRTAPPAFSGGSAIGGVRGGGIAAPAATPRGGGASPGFQSGGSGGGGGGGGGGGHSSSGKKGR